MLLNRDYTVHVIPFYNYDKIISMLSLYFKKLGRTFWIRLYKISGCQCELHTGCTTYVSLLGVSKKSEAKVILHSSAMLKKIKGPFYLINSKMWILNSILKPSVVCIAKNIAALLSKSHAKTGFGDRKGRFCRSPNSLCMGFTFPMDANASKYFRNYFMRIKQTLIRHWENPKMD